MRSPRVPSLRDEISAMPSDGAALEPTFCPRCTLSVVPRSILFFENTFTPSPRRSVIVSRSPTTTGETSTLPAPGAVTVSATSSREIVTLFAASAFSVTRFPMRGSFPAPSATSARLTTATGLSARRGFSSIALEPIATPTCVTVPVAMSSASVSSPNVATKLPSLLTVTVWLSIFQTGVSADSPSYTLKCIVFSYLPSLAGGLSVPSAVSCPR